MNPMSAMTGAQSDQVQNDELVRRFCTLAMKEAQDIGATLGISVNQSPGERPMATRKPGSIKTSMFQDVEAGKQVELDALIGAVRELGEMAQIATPYTDRGYTACILARKPGRPCRPGKA